MQLDELREKLCQQYNSNPEAADAIATANAAVELPEIGPLPIIAEHGDTISQGVRCAGHPDSIGE
jgi:hypothetical protein